MTKSFRLLSLHPMDPRGRKLGGIETHVRLLLTRHPGDFSILFVGIDETGDCQVGKVHRITVDGREIDFLPVAQISAEKINVAAKRLSQSTTLAFALGALRHLGAIRAALGQASASADLQRYEFAIIPRLLGLKTVQMVHGETLTDQKMDSLIKKLWFVHRAAEWLALRLADRVLCVNEDIIRHFRKAMPFAVRKSEVMTVSVDTQRFAPQPFDCGDGIFRIVFAGRLDEFKDPPLMFRILRDLHERLAGRLEFHYLGGADPHRYAEFAAIEPFTVRHGLQDAAGVAAVVARCHAGILTSYFEGLPCFLLETMSTGRPFCAIRLPQYDPFFATGVGGTLVERGQDEASCRAAMVDAYVALWDRIVRGAVTPESVHQLVQPYSLETQMSRLFAHHRLLQGDRPQSRNPAMTASFPAV